GRWTARDRGRRAGEASAARGRSAPGRRAGRHSSTNGPTVTSKAPSLRRHRSTARASTTNRSSLTRTGSPARVSDDLFVVLARAVDLWRRSEGAFDVTVGPFVELWRPARRPGALRPRAALASPARRPRSRAVHL